MNYEFLWKSHRSMSDVIGGCGESGSSKMAATTKWYVGEDGCLSVEEPATGVTYHPTLNTIIVATKAHTLKVYDVTSGCLLKESNLSGKGKCVFLMVVIRSSLEIMIRKRGIYIYYTYYYNLSSDFVAT